MRLQPVLATDRQRVALGHGGLPRRAHRSRLRRASLHRLQGGLLRACRGRGRAARDLVAAAERAMRLAALPMYDLPEVAAATDALWGALARRLSEAGIAGVPDRLRRGVDPREVWASPRLLISQTC